MSIKVVGDCGFKKLFKFRFLYFFPSNLQRFFCHLLFYLNAIGRLISFPFNTHKKTYTQKYGYTANNINVKQYNHTHVIYIILYVCMYIYIIVVVSVL